MATDTDTTFTTTTPVRISDELAANYDAIVADENRTVTYEDIADNAAKEGDAATAAWARDRAASKTQPTEEEEPQRTPDYDALKVDDLKRLAVDRGIDPATLKVKGDFVDALTKWDEAQPAVDQRSAAAAATSATD